MVQIRKNNQEEKNNWIIRLFFALFGVMMFYAFWKVLSTERPNVEFVQIGWLSLSVFVLLLILFYLFLCGKELDKKRILYGVFAIIVISGILLRISSMIFFQTQPYSDYSIPHNFYQQYRNGGWYLEEKSWAEKDFYQRYYAMYPAWFPYMRLVMLLYDIFGFNLVVMQVVNLIVFVGILVLMFLIGRKILPMPAVILACALYSFHPSMIIYTAVTTPDHISSFLILLSIYFWILMEQAVRDAKKKEQYLYTVLFAVSGVLVNWFKPLSVFFLMVFLCMELGIRILPSFQSLASLKQMVKSNWLRYLAFVLSFLVLMTAANKITEHYIGTMLKTETVNSTPLYLLWGYSVDEDGNYDPSIATEKFDEIVSAYDSDLPKAMEVVAVLAKQQIQQNFDQLLSIWDQKFEIAVSGETGYFGGANTSSDTEYQWAVAKVLSDPFNAVASYGMGLLYFLAGAGAIGSILKKKRNPGLMLVCLVVFGYLLVLVLGGVQNRYKSLVIAPLCIGAAFGTQIMKDLFLYLKQIGCRLWKQSLQKKAEVHK